MSTPTSIHADDLPLLRAAVMWRLRIAVGQLKTTAPQATYDAIIECLLHLDQLSQCTPRPGQGSACQDSACHGATSQPELQRCRN